MSVTNEQWGTLLELLRQGNIDRIFAHDKDLLIDRLEAFGRAYESRMSGVRRGGLPERATIGDVLAEHQRNPHRVSTLLQAIAFGISSQMLAMMWMVMLGADIEEIQYSYARRRTSHLVVRVRPPNGETTITFESTEHWDTAVIKLAGLAKSDEYPMIDDFYALRIPAPPS